LNRVVFDVDAQLNVLKPDNTVINAIHAKSVLSIVETIFSNSEALKGIIGIFVYC
jgi:hypothetical protein